MLSTGIIVLIVLMVLCAVLGSIYAYLYLTRINPQCLRQMRGPPKHRGPYSDPGGSNLDDDTTNATSTLTPSTHMFLFRKWFCGQSIDTLIFATVISASVVLSASIICLGRRLLILRFCSLKTQMVQHQRHMILTSLYTSGFSCW